MSWFNVTTPRDKVDNYILKKVSDGLTLYEIDQYALKALKKDENLSVVTRSKKYNCTIEKVCKYDFFMMSIRNRIRFLKNKNNFNILERK